MKKIKLLILFCLISLASFAGNPKYMQVSVVYRTNGTTLFVIDEIGKTEVQNLKSLSKNMAILNNAMEIQAEIQSQLNILAAKGWKVVGISNLGESGLTMVNYLLSKEEDTN